MCMPHFKYLSPWLDPYFCRENNLTKRSVENIVTIFFDIYIFFVVIVINKILIFCIVFFTAMKDQGTFPPYVLEKFVDKDMDEQM